eukprot:12183454-Ditylum_brightwellii.AAC.1
MRIRNTLQCKSWAWQGWNTVCCMINCSKMKPEAVGSCPGIKIWSRAYCFEGVGRQIHHTAISNKVNEDH